MIDVKDIVKKAPFALRRSLFDIRNSVLGPWRALIESQPPAKETISGVGLVSVRQKPTALRMHVQLLGRGKTLEEALAELKDRREAALVQLQTLRTEKASIRSGTPRLSSRQAAGQRQLEKMIRQRLIGRGRKLPKGLQVSLPVTASATLTAEWPLPAAAREKSSWDSAAKAAEIPVTTTPSTPSAATPGGPTCDNS